MARYSPVGELQNSQPPQKHRDGLQLRQYSSALPLSLDTNPHPALHPEAFPQELCCTVLHPRLELSSFCLTGPHKEGQMCTWQFSPTITAPPKYKNTGKTTNAAGSHCPAHTGCPAGPAAHHSCHCRGHHAWHPLLRAEAVCVKTEHKPYTEIQQEGMGRKRISSELHARYDGAEVTTVQLFQTAFR